MSTININSIDYDDVRSWIHKARQKGSAWQEIIYGCEGDTDGLNEMIQMQVRFNGWPKNMSPELWFEIVESLKKEEETREEIKHSNKVAEIHDNYNEVQEMHVPDDPYSCWQLYKKRLKEEKHFSDASIEMIEDSSFEIMKRLSKKTDKHDPVRGLVIGNVQSGKTANMVGLMAMAADWGWNMFIVLSGTIENLRTQTQDRMIHDLNNNGNLMWQTIEHPEKKNSLNQQTKILIFNENAKVRYLTVCLKVKSRLQKLIDWLQTDKSQLEKMKILVIDDEADQAGINTADVYSDEDRKAISKLLINLVYCRSKDAVNNETDTFNGHCGAMNYISYTATPYANVLNEAGENTLYPKHFIRTLGTTRTYFGPDQIFGKPDVDEDTGLNIVREIHKDAVNEISALYESKQDDTLPGSLSDAIEWFICATAAMRYHGYMKPVSMLIHTSQKQTNHVAIAKAIQNWFIRNKKMLPDLCNKIWLKETAEFTKADFREEYPDYDLPDEQIWDYPEYEKIKPFVEELIQSMSPIMMDESSELHYTKSIHLCIDNCAGNKLGDDGEYVRLAYPDKDKIEELGTAPAFIVIGGNTLSRGLTLEGLVSTFFLRTVKQMDTLMQMGRWFGYRTHYELYPRIWMTQDTIEKFMMLADVDDDLREQIYQMQIAGSTPEDFKLTVETSPKVSWLRLTAKNKMQMAESAGIDFSGSDTQLTVYTRDKQSLIDNLNITKSFITLLNDKEKFRKSETGTDTYIWDNVSFELIYENLFKKGFHIAETSRAFQQMDLVAKWVRDSEDRIGNWRVLLCGNERNNLSENKTFKFFG